MAPGSLERIRRDVANKPSEPLLDFLLNIVGPKLVPRAIRLAQTIVLEPTHEHLPSTDGAAAVWPALQQPARNRRLVVAAVIKSDLGTEFSGWAEGVLLQELLALMRRQSTPDHAEQYIRESQASPIRPGAGLALADTCH
jgi:hypothetical protein